ncbi:MAG: aspartate aminotransferase family protein [Pseudomonadota bacterium]|nr:aspartate aminotransferase family protein [Pseudomonadota bacterium]
MSSAEKAGARRDVQDSAIHRSFVEKNQKSFEHALRAREYVPAGTSRALLKHPPFPFYLAHAEGVTGTDLDDNTRIDFHNNYTAQIHGHAHPRINAAVEHQLPRGTAYSAPGAQEYELAKLLCERIGSIEQVVFNNSGTEAVMVALRCARAHTGRNKIGLFEGAYHGASDFVMAGGHDLPVPDDPRRLSRPAPDVGGLPLAAAEDAVLIRYNDPQAVREAVSRYGNELAAILVEPILGAGGVIPADAEFLKVLRAETERAGIVFICDEVISLRVALGGAQGYYGIQPDLTTMAKIIGGGFPIGAVGGRREFMRRFGEPEEGGMVANLGTFSANPISVCAGLEAMQMLDEAIIGHINELGEKARAGIAHAIARHEAPAQITGAGSLFQIHWTTLPVTDARCAHTGDTDLNLLTFLGLCNRGIHVSMRGMAALSTPMSEDHVEALIGAFDETLAELRSEGWW